MAGITTSPFSLTMAPMGTEVAISLCVCVFLEERKRHTNTLELTGANIRNRVEYYRGISYLLWRAPSLRFRQPTHRHRPIMRPTGGVIAAVATAVVATQGARAFVSHTCASSWRTRPACQHQQQKSTCSAIDNRRFRRAGPITALPASAMVQAAGEAADPGDAELSPSSIGEGGQRPQKERRWAAGARRALVRGAASLATFTLGATALSGMSADVQHRLNRGDGATVVSMPGAMKSAEASVFKPFEKRTVEEKLANLPAFMVTNAKGSPYLSPTEANEPQVRSIVAVERTRKKRVL